MITPKQKEMLFKLWNHLGVSMQSPKYLDISFPNPQEFKYLVAQFYGLKRDNPTDTLIALEQDIKQKSNEFLSLPENSPCGGKLRMASNNALATTGYGGVTQRNQFAALGGTFAFEIPEDFVCEDIEDYSDMDEMYRVEQCFTDDCIRGSINKLKEYLKKRYGLILNNIQISSEDNFIGDIPIQKYS